METILRKLERRIRKLKQRIRKLGLGNYASESRTSDSETRTSDSETKAADSETGIRKLERRIRKLKQRIRKLGFGNYASETRTSRAVWICQSRLSSRDFAERHLDLSLELPNLTLSWGWQLPGNSPDGAGSCQSRPSKLPALAVWNASPDFPVCS